VLRVRRRRIDRTVATLGFLAAAATLIPLAALTDAPAPPLARRDPKAAAALVATLRRGERAHFVVEYAFSRERPDGRILRAPLSEARTSFAHLIRTAVTLVIENARERYECELVTQSPQCQVHPVEDALPTSEVMRIAVAIGAYDVGSLGSTTVAGEPGRCFQMRHAHGSPLKAFGDRAELCLTDDGIPLRTRVVGDGEETRVAVRVSRAVDSAALRPLLEGFEKTASALSR
jgi:hypothetical protein